MNQTTKLYRKSFLNEYEYKKFKKFTKLVHDNENKTITNTYW